MFFNGIGAAVAQTFTETIIMLYRILGLYLTDKRIFVKIFDEKEIIGLNQQK